MKMTLWLIWLAVVLAVSTSGCTGAPGGSTGTSEVAPESPESEKKVQQSLGHLAPEDRKLAEQQRYCAVLGNRLGTMGTPLKVMVEGQPVFVCCESCVESAQNNPKETAERAKELRSASGATGSR